jgi:Methylamine utilisation protein MauE
VAYLALGCRCLVGIVFAVSAFSKLRSGPAYRAFAAWLAGLPLSSARARQTAAPVIAVAEAAIVVLLALPWTVLGGFLTATVALAVFTGGTFLAVRRGAGEPCQCFGTSAAPLGFRHAIRNMLLCVAAVAGAATASGGLAHPAGIALSLAAGAGAAVFVLFLDDIAAVLASPAATAGAAPADTAGARTELARPGQGQ